MDKPDKAAGYEFSGPDADGFIRLRMPNLDPNHGGDAYVINIGCDKNAIAEAMGRWLELIDNE